MSKPEFGTKRTCVGCAVRFYDLSRTPPTCPKCGAVQPPEVPRPRYGGRSPAMGGRRAPWQAAPAPAADDAEATVEVAEDDEDADAAVIDDDDDADADVAEIDAEVPQRPGVPE